jgi:hypothetical protein
MTMMIMVIILIIIMIMIIVKVKVNLKQSHLSFGYRLILLVSYIHIRWIKCSFFSYCLAYIYFTLAGHSLYCSTAMHCQWRLFVSVRPAEITNRMYLIADCWQTRSRTTNTVGAAASSASTYMHLRLLYNAILYIYFVCKWRPG